MVRKPAEVQDVPEREDWRDDKPIERSTGAVLHGGDARRDASHGLTDFVLPWEIRALISGMKVAGPAFTFRGHVNSEHSPRTTYLAWTKFLGDIPAGSIGICQPNDHTVAHMGELSAETLKRRGIKGYVVDGGCRDTAFIRQSDFRCGAVIQLRPILSDAGFPEGVGEPITIGSVRIRNDDYVFADDDGVVVDPS